MATAETEKHPRGLYVLFGTEMWERFSFYTVGAMLSLYLRDTRTASASRTPQAASVSREYQMFIYFTPLLGGLIADLLTRVPQGHHDRRRVFMIGHALLAVPDNLLICYLALTFSSSATASSSRTSPRWSATSIARAAISRTRPT